MSVKEKIVNDVAVLTISGKLMGGPETDEVHEKIKSLIADGIKKVVLDLSKVKWMNSRGLGMMMSSYTSLVKEGGFIRLAGVAEKINSLLIMTQIVSFFETYETVDRALANF